MDLWGEYLGLWISLCFICLLVLTWSWGDDPGDRDPLDVKRAGMVAQHIEAKGLRDPILLEAMRIVPRHLFVTESYRDKAYEDTTLPTACGQTTPRPYIIAYMISAAAIGATDRVLQIGTGTGYTAALLSQMCEDVYSIEIIGQLSHKAGQRLQELDCDNVHLRVGDGAQGWPEAAPFDAILVSCVPAALPPLFVSQLKTGGRLLVPLLVEGAIHLVRFQKTETQMIQEVLDPVEFVPMQDDAAGHGS